MKLRIVELPWPSPAPQYAVQQECGSLGDEWFSTEYFDSLEKARQHAILLLAGPKVLVTSEELETEARAWIESQAHQPESPQASQQ